MDPLSILLVEDNPGDVRLLESYLWETSFPWKMRHTSYLEKAVQLAASEPSDVCLLDLSLPDGFGLDTVTKMCLSCPLMPIVVMTSLNDEGMAVAAVRQGAQDYLVKNQLNSQLLTRSIRYAIERKKSEEALAQTVSELRKMDALKDKFLSIVSHDLRNPLTVIIGVLELMGSGFYGSITPLQHEAVTDAIQSADRMNRLIRDLLDVSRIEAGNLVLDRRPVSLLMILRRIVFEADIVGRGRGIRVVGDWKHEDLMVQVDPDRMTQAIENVVANALRFANQEVQLSVTSNAGEIRLSITDDGPGIPSQELSKIFDRFTQADTERSKGGLGLGLSVAREIILAHGGRVWAENLSYRLDTDLSDHLSGACFTIVLPYKKEE